MTTTDYKHFCANINVYSLASEIPPMLIAEYLRAAATMRYTGDPISVHQLIADVEPRLQPLGYKRNGFADECFDKSLGGGTSVADVLKLLSEILKSTFSLFKTTTN